MTSVLLNDGGVPIYPTLAAFPVSATHGALAVDQANDTLYEWNGSAWTPIGPGGGGGGGTVTSVSLSMPSIFNVSGSPVTTAGTLGVTLAAESAANVLAGPATGSAATPTFRPLVTSDIPNIAESQVTNLVANLAAKATHVIPTTNQIVYVSSLSGSNITGDGSYDNPWATVSYAMTQITDSGSNKPYTISILAARQVETADVLWKPYVFIVGSMQRASYIRINGGSFKPDTSMTANSWIGFSNIYVGGGTAINMNMQAIGGNNLEFVIENCTISGTLNIQGRNAGGGDFLEMYNCLVLGAVTLDSVLFQIQSTEFGAAVTVTNTQATSATGTLEFSTLDVSFTTAETTFLNDVAYAGGATLTTTAAITLDSYRGLPPTSQLTLFAGTTVTHRDNSTIVPYTPTTPANWSPIPSNVQQALDTLATTSSHAITSLTGDVTATGPGAAAASLVATSNSTLTTLSALSLPTTQLSGQVTLSQLPTIASDTFLGNGTGGSATPTALTTSQVNALLPTFVGATSTSGVQGLVPAPAAYSGLSGQFLSASGSFVTVDQSNTINPNFSLVATSQPPSGAIKFESTKIFTSITTGKPYAVGVGFIGSPTLTIWDISDQTNPVLTGSFVAAGGGAYNVTFGVVSGVQYAFVGYNSGSHFVVVNLTNPALPVQTSNTVITGGAGSIYGVAFLNGYVYCATQSTGLVVMDVGGGTGSPAVPVQTFQQAGGAKSFGVVAVGSNVYTTMFSTSNPFTIRQLVSWTLSGAGTAAIPSQLQSLQITTAGEALGLSISGNTAFVTSAAAGVNVIDLVDITSPSAMTNLSQINSANAFGSAFFAIANGNTLYVPSGGNVVYGGAIDAYDITTRTSPIHIAQVTSGIASNAGGVPALYGGYLFVADYGNAAGTTGQLEVYTQLVSSPVFGNGVGSTLTLQSLTPSTALVSSSADQVQSSITTATELSYVHGATSNIQAQINALVGSGAYHVNEYVLAPTDITNKFVTLSSAPVNPTLTVLSVIGGPVQSYTADFTVSGSTLSWSGLFLDGVLVSGDQLIVQYY